MRRLFILLLTMSAIVGLSFADDVRYVYWFDSEPTQQELTSGTLDCSHLMTGLHYVHFQAFDTDGVPVPSRSKAFMVMNDYASTVARMTYWIDKETEQHELASTAVDCSGLGLGIHTIHFQGYDENDRPLPPRTRSFLVLPGSDVNNTSYVSTSYWFDKETTRHELTGNVIDCTGLKTGVHTVHLQALDDSDRLTPTMTKTFLVLIEDMTPSNAYSKTEYWFDKETTRHALTGNAIDCSTLKTGLHTVHIQMTDDADCLTPTMTKTFLVLIENMSPTNDYSKAEYWFDKETTRHELTTGAIDCSTLPTGVHVAHFQLTDAEGKVTPTFSKVFMVLDFSAHQLYYWFDDDAARNLMDITETEINIEGLANGHHTLHAMLADANGNVMSTEKQTADFTIICPDGEHVDANNDGICDVCDELFIYSRSTTPGRYGTICLPKGATNADIAGATFYSIAGKRLNGEGLPSGIVLEEIDDLVAGCPYIFLASESTLHVTYSGQAADVAGSENGLVGSFEGCDVSEGMYLLSSNRIVMCGTGCSIDGNRAYINMANVPEYVEGSVESSRMVVIGFDDTTHIHDVSAENHAPAYNLWGIRVPKGTKGITIIDGKKVSNF